MGQSSDAAACDQDALVGLRRLAFSRTAGRWLMILVHRGLPSFLVARSHQRPHDHDLGSVSPRKTGIA
jgi:hypothetical protein